MTERSRFTRRTALKAVGAGIAGALVPRVASADEPSSIKGNIKQSVSRWCYGRVPFDKLVREAKRMGYRSVELLGPREALAVKKAGLTCAMLNCPGVSIGHGLNRVENHSKIIAGLKKTIDFAAEHGFPSVITFSGNRRGMGDDEGATNCIAGLEKIVGHAEKKKVTICMELLNSRVDHKDYMADTTPWGVWVCQEVGSERFKLLYDIYHMQIMEGDIIARIRRHANWFGHIHTGGVPGRNEIDESQELNYPAIMKALLKAGYKGYVGQEFVPRRDPLKSMEQAFRICDV